MQMIDEDLKSRARNILRGHYRMIDFDRLFLGLRSRAASKPCFRELGDFVAHRDTREKGFLTQVGRDVFISLDVWSMKTRGIEPTFSDLRRAADANLRLANDVQMSEGCGCSKATAKQRLKRGFEKLEKNRKPTDKELRVLEYLANRFIWRPAFTADQLFDEFGQLLAQCGIIDRAEMEPLENSKVPLTLYALTVMHGSAIILENGQRSNLYAGYANREGKLEVKMEIVFAEQSKPILSPICLFQTDLGPEDHCEADMLGAEAPVLIDHWKRPIELNSANKLACV